MTWSDSRGIAAGGSGDYYRHLSFDSASSSTYYGSAPKMAANGEFYDFKVFGPLAAKLDLPQTHTISDVPIYGFKTPQWAQLEWGRWNGKQLGDIRIGHRPVKHNTPLPPKNTSAGRRFKKYKAEFLRSQGRRPNEMELNSWLDQYWGTWDAEKKYRVCFDRRANGEPKMGLDGRFIEKAVTEPYRTGLVDAPLALPKWVGEYFVRLKTDEERRQLIQIIEESGVETWMEWQQFAKVARANTGKTTNDKSKSKAAQYGQQRFRADMLTAMIVQFTNRDGQPHLHLHMPTFTACQLDDERWATADEFGWKSTAWFREDVAEGHIVRKIRERLGLQIKTTDPEKTHHGKILTVGAESKKALRDMWTSNSPLEAQKEFAAVVGRQPTRQEEEAWRSAMRPRKIDKQQDQNPDVSRWINEANERMNEKLAEAKTDKERQAIRDRMEPTPISSGKPIEPLPIGDRFITLHKRLVGRNGICKNGEEFTGNKIREAIAHLSIDLELTPEQRATFEQRFRQELITVREAQSDDYTYYTTRELIRAENFVQVAENEKAERSEGVPEWFARAQLEKDPFPYTDEQVDAIIHGATAGGMAVITGVGGAGKSTIADAIGKIRKAYNETDEIILSATSARCARKAGRGMTSVSEYGSIRRILTKAKFGHIKDSEKLLVILEEGAFVNTWDYFDLHKALPKAKFIYIGDDTQLTEIGPGGVFSEAAERFGSATLIQSKRQQDPADRRDFFLWREGNSHQALANLADRNRVHLAEDIVERRQLVMDYYKSFLLDGYTAADIRVIIDTTNEEVDAMARMVQQVLRENGDLRGNGFEIEFAEADRTWRVYEGEQIRFREVYSEKTGRRVTKTWKGKDGKRHSTQVDEILDIQNGTSAEILRLDEQSGRAKLKLDDDRVVEVILDQRQMPAEAIHEAAFQGDEIPINLYMPGVTTTLNSSYSSLTRCTRESHVFIDHETFGERPAEKLADQCAEKANKHTATYRIENPSPFANPRMAQEAENLTQYLFEEHGRLAHHITNSPAYQSLVVRVNRMVSRGDDAHQIVSEVIAQREMNTAEDVAKVIMWRLDRWEKKRTTKVETDEFGWTILDEKEMDESIRLDPHVILSKFNRQTPAPTLRTYQAADVSRGL